MNATTVYGIQIERSEYVPRRSVIGAPEVTASGNLVLPVGREHDSGWSKSEHVVMTPDEAEEFARSILSSLGRG